MQVPSALGHEVKQYCFRIKGEVGDVLAASGLPAEILELVRKPLCAPGRVLHERGAESSLPPSLLTLLIAEAAGGECGLAASAAAAVEFLFAAAEVFDDLEDGELGDWPCSPAEVLNVGCVLLMLAGRAALRLAEKGAPGALLASVLDSLSSVGLRGCHGQHLDLGSESRLDVGYDQYLTMARLKSGSFIEGACRAGASVGTQDPAVIDRFGRFGAELGVIAQIRNDLRELAGIKESDSDLLRRKKTLPVIYALSQAEGKDRELVGAFFRPDGFPPGDHPLEEVRGAVVEAGGLHFACVVLEIFRSRALAILESLPVSGTAKEMLARFVAA